MNAKRKRAIKNIRRMTSRIRAGVAFTAFGTHDFMLPGGLQPEGGVRLGTACTLGCLIIEEAGKDGVIPVDVYDHIYSPEFKNPLFFFTNKHKIGDIILSIPYNLLYLDLFAQEDGDYRIGNLDSLVEYEITAMIVRLNDYSVPAWIKMGLLPADTDPRLFIADYLDAIADEGLFKLEDEVNVE